MNHKNQLWLTNCLTRGFKSDLGRYRCVVVVVVVVDVVVVVVVDVVATAAVTVEHKNQEMETLIWNCKFQV